MKFTQLALPSTSDYDLEASCKEEGGKRIKKTEIQRKFLEFFEERQEDKDRTYRSVHVWGRNMFIVSGFSSVFAQNWLQYNQKTGTLLFWIAYALFVITLTGMVCGFLMVCTVPTDELDFESNSLIMIGKVVRYMDICNLMAIDADASDETLNRRGRVVLKWIAICLSVQMCVTVCAPIFPYVGGVVMVFFIWFIFMDDPDVSHTPFVDRLLHHPTEEAGPMTLLGKAWLVSVPLWCTMFMLYINLAIDPAWAMKHDLGIVLKLSSRTYDRYENMAALDSGTRICICTLLSLVACVGCVGSVLIYRHNGDAAQEYYKDTRTMRKGWQTNNFYDMCLFDMFLMSLQELIFVVGAQYFNIEFVLMGISFQGLWMYVHLFIAILGLGASISVFIVTREWLFNVCAVAFEKDHVRLMKDGATMAELTQLSMQLEEGMNWWIWRSGTNGKCGGDKRFEKETDGYILRKFFMRGTVLASPTIEDIGSVCDMNDDKAKALIDDAHVMFVCVDVLEDMDWTWNMKFLNVTPIREWSEQRNGTSWTYDEWFKMNFEQTESEKWTCKVLKHADSRFIIASNDVSQNERRIRYERGDDPWHDKGKLVVAVRIGEGEKDDSKANVYDQDPEKAEKSPNGDGSLLDYAEENLRRYKWTGEEGDEKAKDSMKRDLLDKSPRELGDDVNLKKEVYALSESVKVSKQVCKKEGIDYFISHTWEDDAQEKLNKLNEFSEKFKASYWRYPTFWLDKVCIDQNNSGKGIAVLPVNIAACDRLLVLMSNAYLKRLWCIWELYSLFVFCRKEIAISRLEVTYLSGSQNDNTAQTLRQQLLKFAESDLDAHCFDPNEELKLRMIMNDVNESGTTTIQETMRIISNQLALNK